MKIINKLIRDRIPEIIESSGRNHRTVVLDDKKYIDSLNKKLNEELEEYQESKKIEELADIVEVIYGILKYKGVSIEEFDKIRLDKKEKRGGFDKRLFLISTDEPK